MAASKICGFFDKMETPPEHQEENQLVAGYDFKTKSTAPNAPNAYQCIICHLIIRKFTELPCGHAYCKNCLLRWEQRKTEENERLNR